MEAEISKLDEYIKILSSQIQQFCVTMVRDSPNCESIPLIEEIQIYFMKQKSLYKVLNMCQIDHNFYKASFWIVTD